jgi:altronate dehydratase large subunit
MDTPYFSPESITAMVAGGAQIVLFTTGAGNSYCSLVAPTLKMSANPETCARLTEQIDIAAADVATGGTTIDARARLQSISSWKSPRDRSPSARSWAKAPRS